MFLYGGSIFLEQATLCFIQKTGSKTTDHQDSGSNKHQQLLKETTKALNTRKGTGTLQKQC